MKKTLLILALAAAALSGCATTSVIELTPEQAEKCKQKDCYVVRHDALQKALDEAYKRGVSAGKGWL